MEVRNSSTLAVWLLSQTLDLSQPGEVKSLSRFRLFATPWTVAYQAFPSMGFSKQEYWSGMPSPSLLSAISLYIGLHCRHTFAETIWQGKLNVMTHLIPEIVRLPCDFLKQNFYFIIVLNFQNIVKIVQRVPVCLTTSSPIINILHSVQFSCSVMSDSLRSHESRHARSPCPSPTPGVHSNSRPSSP